MDAQTRIRRHEVLKNLYQRVNDCETLHSPSGLQGLGIHNRWRYSAISPMPFPASPGESPSKISNRHFCLRRWPSKSELPPTLWFPRKPHKRGTTLWHLRESLTRKQWWCRGRTSGRAMPSKHSTVCHGIWMLSGRTYRCSLLFWVLDHLIGGGK